jgi:hypothetical protein
VVKDCSVATAAILTPRLQRMQVGEQIVDLLLVQHLAVCGHLVSAESNYVTYSIIVGGHPALGKKLALE